MAFLPSPMIHLLRYLYFVVCVFAFIPSLQAIEKDGIQLTVQKTTLDRSRDPDQFYEWDKVSKALALKVSVSNNSIKDLEPATVEYVVIVQRWGYSPRKYKCITGKEALSALSRGKTQELTVGRIQLDGWESSSNRKDFVDRIDAWQVRVVRDGKELIALKSSTSFDRLYSKAAGK